MSRRSLSRVPDSQSLGVAILLLDGWCGVLVGDVPGNSKIVLHVRPGHFVLVTHPMDVDLQINDDMISEMMFREAIHRYLDATGLENNAGDTSSILLECLDNLPAESECMWRCVLCHGWTLE